MDNEDEKIEEQQGESEILDFAKPDYTFVPKDTHNWKQRGYYIHCTSCDLEHGVYIGSGQLLVGLAGDGSPILKKRE